MYGTILCCQPHLSHDFCSGRQNPSIKGSIKRAELAPKGPPIDKGGKNEYGKVDFCQIIPIYVLLDPF